MVAIYLSPLYIGLNIYIARWLLLWMGACSHHFKKRWVRVILISVYTFFAVSLLVGFLLPPGTFQRFFKQIGNYWLGVLMYVILTVAAAEVLRFFAKRSRRLDQKKVRSRRTFVAAGTVCIATVLTVSIWGAVHARVIRTSRYEVTIQKEVPQMEQMKVVLAADLHLGYNIGCRQMERMVEKINRENADLVVIAGDIFDNEYEALDNPKRLAEILRGIKSKYGVYACYGNHDIEEKILVGFTFGSKEKKESDIRMDELLKDADIQLLQDEAVLIDDRIYLYGRPDRQRPGRGIKQRKTPEEITADMDLDKPIFVMDHQPAQLTELSRAGVDLDLGGHTHDGQLFPGSLTTSLMWENSCGYLLKDQMHSIVTSGVGLFGPNMRVGTKAEICAITVNFQG